MLKEIDKENTGFVDLLEFARITFNIKEEKPKEPKDPKKGEAKKDGKKKKWGSVGSYTLIFNSTN